ncbi:hypothetical protein [Streptomyces sp. H39-C1]|uniref:hypothetical protein n=1 Tax=Streptomyces sp. H39-C1 TaxID=3004355 RepID=UPI0022AE7EF0|nr:hypothetical protein [Streptomyces sp. H39-C1]MCZ4102641.1 hypothetical protein [Streptomyces sp. H39-C1]
MSDSTWPVRLSPRASSYLAALDPVAQELAADVLDIAARAPLHWPAWDASDPEGADLRGAAVGQLSLLYVINRTTQPPHLYVLDIVWAG